MRGFLLFLLLAALAWLALQRGWIAVPDAWNPWAPLDLDHPPNPLTRHKIARLADDPEACGRLLAQSGFASTAVDDRRGEDGCGWRNAWRIGAGSQPSVGSAFTLQCPVAAALAIWERHTLQPAALEYYDSPATALDHFGSYACRDVRGGRRRSEHAFANAFDLAGVRLENGRRITLARDWDGDDRDAAFLRTLRDGACRVFGGVLGPDYNAAHHDHFHFDRGGYRICR